MFALGTDGGGNSFRDPVCTLDVCAGGARITNVQRRLKIGDELTLEYKKYKVRFRIAWIGAAGSSAQGQVGLQAIDSVKRIADLDELLSGSYVDTWTPKVGAKIDKAAAPAATE
jgi:hypothetical protein